VIKDDTENSYIPTTIGLAAGPPQPASAVTGLVGSSGVVGGDEVVPGTQMIRPHLQLIGISSMLPVFASS